MHEEKPLEVRDLRHQDWLWTSKQLLFNKDVDEKMYKVYSGLAAYANNQTQKAFPSIGTMMQKLHMGRNTIIRALQKLESFNLISVEREKGANNIYSLLEISSFNTTTNEAEPEAPKLQRETTPKPAQTTREFFKGVQDLRDKNETKEATIVREFLLSLSQRYREAPKSLIWSEIQKFERYWTELNSTGSKERWQMETTFQVDRRLVTWFIKKDQFKTTVGTAGKGNKVIA